MIRSHRRTVLVGTLLLFACLGTTGTSRADIPPGLFSNYYVGPPGLPAQMYVSPRPTPPFVGHTWITYPPFAPHEYLYKHGRTYYRANPDGGYTKVFIHWH